MLICIELNMAKVWGGELGEGRERRYMYSVCVCVCVCVCVNIQLSQALYSTIIAQGYCYEQLAGM